MSNSIKSVYRNVYLYYLSVSLGCKSVCSSPFLADSDEQAFLIARDLCKFIPDTVFLYRFARVLEYVDSCSVCSDFKLLGEVISSES